ncbi:ABC transporter substrate-binding protein [Microbacterium sp. SORGH_AS_0505]|uniref:ABC transporter substrate-binding protein n=1 Tax=Microbacterium sp. SORGH_AS_0505 TaxID=3041770 RepID=UPI0027D780EA|nr:ABC transporter substrate-binding protein [Microbacterium sp. SORGH_AS_0505]
MSRIRTTAAWAAAAVFAVSLVGCSPAASDSGGSFDPDEKVSLDFAWWGNDDRAARYATLIEAFNEEHPNITIKTTFTDFPSYWEQRQVEAASGSLPDVFQFSDSYLRQYGESGAILDLDEVADQIDFTTFDDSLLGTGRLDGTQYSLPTGYSLWANFVNEDLLKEHGLELPAAGSSFDEFNDWLAEVTDNDGRGSVRRHRLHAAHPGARAAVARRRQGALHGGGRARVHEGRVGGLLGIWRDAARRHHDPAAAARGDQPDLGLRLDPDAE